MFTIISIMFVGIGIGYVLRHLQFLQKIEKSTSLTIFLLLIRMAGGYIGYIKHFGQYASFFPGISSVF